MLLTAISFQLNWFLLRFDGRNHFARVKMGDKGKRLSEPEFGCGDF